MTATETIRKAARLMRERAEAACPGPYFTTGKSGRYGGMVAAPRDGYPEHDGYDGHLIGESMSGAHRSHLAGWAPEIAVAVADWLEAVADLYDKPISLPPAHPTDVDAIAFAAVMRGAETVARTYLTREKQPA